MSKYKEKAMKAIFVSAAAVSMAAVAVICIFLLIKGIPALRETGPVKFITGRLWLPGEGIYGILPMIASGAYITAGAMITGAPVGLLCAIFLARFCPDRLYGPLKAAVELMAGIPSIVYGFFGLKTLVPLVQGFTGGTGKGIVTASVLLGIMILPTIIIVTEAALRAVSEDCYRGARALGATHEQSVFFTVLPAARQGVVTGLVLGMGRAAGETMAVVMVAGNQAVFPDSVFSGVRTLTANIVLEMGYAGEGMHRDALMASALVLLIFVMLINTSLALLKEERDI